MELSNENSTNYPLSVKEQLLKIEYTDSDEKKLKYYQFIVKEFFTRNKNARGLLINHEMGTGKTRLAVSITDFFAKEDVNRQIIILLSKSLEGNFRKTITEYTGDNDEIINEKYNFVSLNSSNMFKQISTVHKSDEEKEYEKKLELFMSDIKTKNSLNNSLLVIDEAHNLFNAITNGAKNAVLLYDLIMNAYNLKIIFLTGTPIINNPFEVVPCYNMLRGYIYDNDTDNDQKFTLFSEDSDEFDKFFVDREHKTIKNKDKFMNRIFGLTSYYGKLYFPLSGEKQGFPKKLETIIEKIPMTEHQFGKYLIARALELEETSKKFKSSASRFSSGSGGNSSYRVKTRQISNFSIPDYALGPTIGKKAREKFIDKIKPDELKSGIYSSKMSRILHNISHFKDSPGMVYSQFVSGEGLAIFAKILEVNGYEYINEENIYDIKDKKTLKYAILSGDIDPELRLQVINKFNSVENSNGSIIKILLLSGAVAEGIDLKRIRHVHIMEPFWNYARINQVETRAIRYLSHEDLPKNKQNVQVYIYLSDYPKDYPKKKITEATTDVELYEKSINNMKIIDSFTQAVAESSMDCSLHYENIPKENKEMISCLMCNPDNNYLYHPIINKDMTIPNHCKPLKKKTVTAEEIIYEPTGEVFYYKKNPENPLDIHLYIFNKKLNGYINMNRDHKLYAELYEKILSGK